MRPRTLRLAHRGDWRTAPENTIAAFRSALGRARCDGLEFDVRRSLDGVPVVIHDDTLDRVQGRSGRVDALTASALEDAGVPSLADALAAIPRRAFLDVELKVDAGPATVEILAAARGPELHNAVISSFDRGALEHVARLAPGWPRWLNATSLDAAALDAARELGCRGVSVEWHAIDDRSVAAAGDAGLQVAAWTVRRRPTVERLERMGIVAVCVEGSPLDG